MAADMQLCPHLHQKEKSSAFGFCKKIGLVSSFLVTCAMALGQTASYHVRASLGSPDTTHYHNGDTIYALQGKGHFDLHVFGPSGRIIANGLHWQWGSTNRLSVATLRLGLDSMGVFPVQVYRADTLLMAFTLAVYPMPVFYFQPGYQYDGEYGFDDSTHQYLHIRNNPQFAYGYQVRKMPGDTAYFVPWMSLLHGQWATIRYHIKQWTGLAGQDRKGYLELRPEAGSHIRINGAVTARFYFNKLKARGILDISALQWVADPDSLRLAGDYQAIVKGIYVITHTGDTIGKLNLSCAKPAMKQIFFVYVNIGRGYDSSVLSRTNMLRQLNRHSHNQLMRQWVINNDFPDTLDLTAAYFANPHLFKADTMPELLKDCYKTQTGIDIATVNRFRGGARSANFVRFLFITNFAYPRLFNFKGFPWIRWLNGITAANFDCYAALFETANLKTVCHELGHMLKHDHTQDKPFGIIGKATHNVMDYSITGFQTIFNRFWYAQWVKTF
jgi:predicted Zn-dependent protease